MNFRLQKVESDDNVKNTHRPFLKDTEHTNCTANSRRHLEEDQYDPPYRISAKISPEPIAVD